MRAVLVLDLVHNMMSLSALLPREFDAVSISLLGHCHMQSCVSLVRPEALVSRWLFHPAKNLLTKDNLFISLSSYYFYV